jgi:hypothetical protein
MCLLTPKLQSSAIYSVFQSFFGGKQNAFNFLVPFLQDYLQKREDMEDESVSIRYPNTYHD